MTSSYPGPPATIAELDRRHVQATALIRRRAARAGARALVIGRESLPALLDEIAEIYGLDAADRERLAPEPEAAAPMSPAGIVAGLGLTDAAGLARRAASGGKLASIARKVATRGAGAGALAARAGALAGRAVPLAAAAWGAYAVGTGGWFLYRANAFERAAHDLLRARIRGGR